jgi:hypothetical protein
MNQRVDDDVTTRPIDPTDVAGRDIGAFEVRARFHFPDPNDSAGVRENDPEIRAAVLKAAKEGDYKLFGVLLHVYMDTFAHAGYGNVKGHAGGGHQPDQPWLAEHAEREERMAKALYGAMETYATAQGMDLTGKSYSQFWRIVKTTHEWDPGASNAGAAEVARCKKWMSLVQSQSRGASCPTYSYGIEAQSESLPWISEFRRTAARVRRWY